MGICKYVDPLTGLRCEEPGIVIRQDAHAEFENHAACTLHFPDLVHGSDGLEGYCMGCYRMRPSAEVQNFPAARCVASIVRACVSPGRCSLPTLSRDVFWNFMAFTLSVQVGWPLCCNAVLAPASSILGVPCCRICAKCRREELEEKRQQLAKEKQQADQEEQELHRQLELVAQKKGQILAKEREIQAEEKAIEEKQEADKKRRLDPDAAAYSTAVPAVPPVTTTPTVQDQTADLQRAGQHEAEVTQLP